MAEPQLSAPRISAPYLDSCVGQNVMLVGKVTQLRGDQATLDSDGIVTVLLNRVCFYPPSFPTVFTLFSPICSNALFLSGKSQLLTDRPQHRTLTSPTAASLKSSARSTQTSPSRSSPLRTLALASICRCTSPSLTPSSATVPSSCRAPDSARGMIPRVPVGMPWGG